MHATSLPSQALHAFRSGHYEKALRLYELMADSLGYANVAANIRLCKRRMRTTTSFVGPLCELQLVSTHNSHNAKGCQPRFHDFNNILQTASSLPTSRGSAISRLPFTVGVISDVYLFNYYKDCFEHCIYLSPSNWRSAFDTHKFDLILYTTCWQGLDQSEWRGHTADSEAGSALRGIIARARKQRALLVFQSIEDPSNYLHFLPVARQFDYIFTADEECIGKYTADCRHERVYYGEYGVNPLVHNPIGCRNHFYNAAFFAGSWPVRYQQRCLDMGAIFDSVLNAGVPLVVADRNFGTKHANLRYPDKYADCLVPSIDHELLQAVHKLFRYSLNFNSIRNSPTMCAMRSYELQAMGIGVISNYARSVFNNFPEMPILPVSDDISDFFLPKQTFREYRRNMSCLRNVMSSNTSFEKANAMMTILGVASAAKPFRVAVIADALVESVAHSFQRQTYSDKILVRYCDIDSAEKWLAFQQTNAVSYFTWFTAADEYERNYLQDMVNGFKYTAARFVCKSAWFDGNRFNDGVQHNYTSIVPGKARTMFCVSSFRPEMFANAGAYEERDNIPQGYALDPFELNYVATERIRKPVVSSTTYDLSVIVPVYNNGRFLLNKCMSSILRAAKRAKVQILLIDDGSTDETTCSLVKECAQLNSNISTYFFQDGGSGSASRARNKGLELADAPLISFLDPDNEINAHAYDTLIDLLHEARRVHGPEIDFVSGYHVKVAESTLIIGCHADDTIVACNNLKDTYLCSGRFPTVATQPAVLDRRLFADGTLTFIEEAVGQDTLFGWQVLCKARAGAFTNAVYVTYYAQRRGSVVNSVDADFFAKSLILERAQSHWLKSEGLYDFYKRHRYKKFMDNWYRPRLDSITDPSTRKTSADLLRQIASFYE